MTNDEHLDALETYLVEQLKMIAEAHQKAAEPFAKQLADLRAIRIPRYIIPMADLLAHMPQIKTEPAE